LVIAATAGPLASGLRRLNTTYGNRPGKDAGLALLITTYQERLFVPGAEIQAVAAVVAR